MIKLLKMSMYLRAVSSWELGRHCASIVGVEMILACSRVLHKLITRMSKSADWFV